MKQIERINSGQAQLFNHYVELLIKWNQGLNLIGRSTESEVWQRHVIDSAQAVDLIKDKKLDICDLGSGAGLPGVVLNILGCCNITLVESDQKKCIFLREVKRSLKLNFHILNLKVEEIEDRQFDVIISRAMASVHKIFSLSRKIVKKESIFILFKGKEYQSEISEAMQYWSFTLNTYSSKSNDDGVLLVISNILNKDI